MANNKPMMELEPNPKDGIPVLCYNVPEPTSYSMNNLISINLSDFGDTKGLKDVFVDSSFVSKRTQPAQNQANLTFSNPLFFEKIKIENEIALAKSKEKGSLNNVIATVELYSKLNKAAKIITSKFSGKTKVLEVKPTPKIEPQILIVEKYRLSTFTGAYGAGKTINTFTLLPGEKTKISIKTYLKTEESRKEASSILDSFTEDNAEEFEDSVMSENSSKENNELHAEVSVEAEGEYNAGVGKVKANAKASAGGSIAREEFAKNIQNATTKNANKASSKRENQVNTSSESSTSSGEETDIVREIENINVSRTMNFVFRQMNQEYITVLHMTDIRIGFFNGEHESIDIVTLPELDDLLEKYIKQPKQKAVRTYIEQQIKSIVDYNDSIPQPFDRNNNKILVNNNPAPFIKERQLKNAQDQNVGNPILSFAKDYYTEYSDNKGRKFTVQGIITSAKTNVMRTSGIIVDTILGEGNALDNYSQGLQDQAVKEKDLNNEIKKLEIEKIKLANEIIKTDDKVKADLFEKVYPVIFKEPKS